MFQRHSELQRNDSFDWRFGTHQSDSGSQRAGRPLSICVRFEPVSACRAIFWSCWHLTAICCLDVTTPGIATKLLKMFFKLWRPIKTTYRRTWCAWPDVSTKTNSYRVTTRIETPWTKPLNGIGKRSTSRLWSTVASIWPQCWEHAASSSRTTTKCSKLVGF